MENKDCGCQYDGPVQVLCCGAHNVAAKNVDRAQVMINKLEIKIEKARQKLDMIGTFPCNDEGCYNTGLGVNDVKRIHTLRCPRGVAVQLRQILDESVT